MFEKIIVDNELLPLRNAASNGDLDAMCTLARHIIEGDRTTLCVETVALLCDKILEHESFGDDVERARDVIKLLADHTAQSYREERISYEDYIEGVRLMLQQLVQWTVFLPEEQWNLYELKHSVDWLYENELEPLPSDE